MIVHEYDDRSDERDDNVYDDDDDDMRKEYMVHCNWLKKTGRDFDAHKNGNGSLEFRSMHADKKSLICSLTNAKESEPIRMMTRFQR